MWDVGYNRTLKTGPVLYYLIEVYKHQREVYEHGEMYSPVDWNGILAGGP